MRLLLTATSCLPDYGGPAFFVTKLAAALASKGAHVSLWAADGSALKTPLLPSQASIERLSGNLVDVFSSNDQFDLLHDHGVWLPHNHTLAAIAFTKQIPRVVSTHGMLDPWCLNHKRLKKKIAWYLYQKADLKCAALHHVTSQAERENLIRLDLGAKICLVPIGVDIPDALRGEHSNIEHDGLKTAVFLGRINPVKGLPMLIEAWRQVRPDGWRLRVAGPDNDGHRKEVEDLVAVNGLEGVVFISGPLQGAEKEKFLHGANLFVLASHSESFGLAIAEALAHQLPVLTTTAAPWSTLEREGFGWSVEPTVDGLTTGLRRATQQSKQTLAEMGAKGRKWIEAHLRWDHVADEFISFYETTVNSHSRGPFDS